MSKQETIEWPEVSVGDVVRVTYKYSEDEEPISITGKVTYLNTNRDRLKIGLHWSFFKNECLKMELVEKFRPEVEPGKRYRFHMTGGAEVIGVVEGVIPHVPLGTPLTYNVLFATEAEGNIKHFVRLSARLVERFEEVP
jgi:hypothetical protein